MEWMRCFTPALRHDEPYDICRVTNTKGLIPLPPFGFYQLPRVDRSEWIHRLLLAADMQTGPPYAAYNEMARAIWPYTRLVIDVDTQMPEAEMSEFAASYAPFCELLSQVVRSVLGGEGSVIVTERAPYSLSVDGKPLVKLGAHFLCPDSVLSMDKAFLGKG
jgi:hypothetical protein